MTVALLAPAGASEAEALESLLRDHDPDGVVRLTLNREARITLDATGVVWNGTCLNRVRALWVHGFSYQDPVLPPADPVCDWSLWQTGHVVQQQRHSFLYSVLCRLEAAGVALYNPPSALLGAFDRFGQLDRLGRAGFAVPSLLLANDDRSVESFLERNKMAVWRPATGGAAWQRLGPRQRRHLIGHDRPPVLLAHIAPGPYLRAYVVDGRPVMILAGAAPDRAEIERLETFHVVDERDIPGVEQVAAAADRLGCRLAQVSFVAGADRPVIYDCDPDPVAGELPDRLRTRLREAVAAALRGRPAPAVSLAALREAGPDTRPALLLRRMLAIQFDMEASKYQDG